MKHKEATTLLELLLTPCVKDIFYVITDEGNSFAKYCFLQIQPQEQALIGFTVSGCRTHLQLSSGQRTIVSATGSCIPPDISDLLDWKLLKALWL